MSYNPGNIGDGGGGNYDKTVCLIKKQKI